MTLLGSFVHGLFCKGLSFWDSTDLDKVVLICPLSKHRGSGDLYDSLKIGKFIFIYYIHTLG